MRNRQRGVTALGWLILLTPMVIVLYAGMRVAPLYLNYMKVTRAVDQAGGELKDVGHGGAGAIRSAIDRHFEIDMVEYPTTKDFKITHEGTSWTVEIAYDDEAPLFDNISLHVTFHKLVKMTSNLE